MERMAILVTAAVSLGLTGISGFFVIPWLRSLKYGQSINEIGPVWHKSKEGTPTMGGVMIIFGVTVAIITGYITLVLEVPQFTSRQYFAENIRLFAGLGAALLFGGIGFFDDYIKIKHHENAGLTAKEKLVLQFAVSAAYVYVMYAFGASGTAVELPFIGSVELGFWYFPISVVFISFFVNAVNLTDGIDGLASSVTFIVSLGFIIISAYLGYISSGLLSAAVAGACIGFVMWNFFPAKVFMGDTGSLFLGGAVMAMTYGVSFPTLIILAGIVYLCEAGSVMMQVLYFKLTHGKRIFKMTPIHHHFELSGFSEVGIVLLFGLVTLIGCAAAILAVVTL